MAHRRGRLIVLEGVGGSGKTTQADLLERRIGRALRAHEPGGTPIGETVRALLKDARRKKIAPLTEIFLFMASRAPLLDEVVRPALKAGKTVLLDRSFYSTTEKVPRSKRESCERDGTLVIDLS